MGIIVINTFERREKIRWPEVQDRFPNEWVVLEVIKAQSNEGNRYIEEVIVIDRFEQSIEAMHRYDKLRLEQPQREYCFFHTSRPKLVARERYIGIRGRR
ncbi:hypothetical protein ACOI1C_19535 [Bacillus sp. DJP31]|uniref:hypothetical protein n=1 Tax=Bacillus sp. DJP31 TaxID=3409789 RepID=UPI003BB60D8C